MKKIRILPLVLPILLLLSACGGTKPAESAVTTTVPIVATTTTTLPETVLQLGTTYSEPHAKFSLFKIVTSDRVTASMDTSYFYENMIEGELFVDVVFDVTNCGSEPLRGNAVMQALAVTSDSTECRRVLYAFETSNNTYVMESAELAPQASGRLHCAISVPETASEISLRFTVGETVYTRSYQLHSTVREDLILELGETVTAEGFASLTLTSFGYTDDVLPVDTSGDYRHYPVANPDNTYLTLYMIIHSQQESAKREDSFVKIKARYPDRTVYEGMIVVVNRDAKGFSQGTAIIPGTDTVCCYLIEVPKTAAAETVELTIVFNGNEYVFIS